jgi:hypothetical protein
MCLRLGTSQLDVHKVDLELLVALHADDEGRTTTSSDDLVGEVR